MENTFEHLVQPKGFSPVWTLKWTCRLAFLANDLKHTEQQKFLSPVWTVKWRRKLDSWEYTCKHFGHPQGFSLEWTFKWSCRWLSWVSAAVIPRIHSAPASPLKLPLLNEIYKMVSILSKKIYIFWTPHYFKNFIYSSTVKYLIWFLYNLSI